MLDVMQSYFGLDDPRMFREINAAFSKLLEILAAKKIDYASLKSALVPRPDRNEAAFVFDTQSIASGSCGCDVFRRLLPALDKRGTHSILCGDYIGNNNIQDRLYEAFEKEVELARPCTWKHSSQFFVVYVNNLSDQMLAGIRASLDPYEGYAGYASCNAPSFFKTYLSTILCNCFLKAKLLIIQGHPDDLENAEDENTLGYPFEAYGYTCKSLQSIYESLFLSYKIERAVYPGFESDTLFSLNSISDTVVPLDKCTLEIEEAKLSYLRKEKQGSMKRSGMVSLAREEVEMRIRERLASNYIFNMVFVPEHRQMKFNTLLNFMPDETGRLVKITASLDYLPVERRLRLITLF